MRRTKVHVFTDAVEDDYRVIDGVTDDRENGRHENLVYLEASQPVAEALQLTLGEAPSLMLVRRNGSVIGAIDTEKLVADLKKLVRNEPALHEIDFGYEGFEWIDCHNWQDSIVAFIRKAKERKRDYTVDWVHLKLNDQAQRTVLCKDPFRSQDERVHKLIEGM